MNLKPYNVAMLNALEIIAAAWLATGAFLAMIVFLS